MSTWKKWESLEDMSKIVSKGFLQELRADGFRACHTNTLFRAMDSCWTGLSGTCLLYSGTRFGSCWKNKSGEGYLEKTRKYSNTHGVWWKVLRPKFGNSFSLRWHQHHLMIGSRKLQWKLNNAFSLSRYQHLVIASRGLCWNFGECFKLSRYQQHCLICLIRLQQRDYGGKLSMDLLVLLENCTMHTSC